MTTETEQYFLERAAESGIPTTTDAIKNDIQADADDAGLTFNNPSEYSPWWKFLTAIAVNPVNQLIQFVITHVMPNLFFKTATGDYLDILGEDKDESTIYITADWIEKTKALKLAVIQDASLNLKRLK